MRSEESPHFVAVNYFVIGRNIRTARHEKGLRQAEMADRLGISTTHYSNLERGSRNISLSLLYGICLILNTSIEEILEGSSDNVQIAHVGVKHKDSMQSTNDWLDSMQNLQRGCSQMAQQFMLEACRNISLLDRRRNS